MNNYCRNVYQVCYKAGVLFINISLSYPPWISILLYKPRDIQTKIKKRESDFYSIPTHVCIIIWSTLYATLLITSTETSASPSHQYLRMIVTDFIHIHHHQIETDCEMKESCWMYNSRNILLHVSLSFSEIALYRV